MIDALKNFESDHGDIIFARWTTDLGLAWMLYNEDKGYETARARYTQEIGKQLWHLELEVSETRYLKNGDRQIWYSIKYFTIEEVNEKLLSRGIEYTDKLSVKGLTTEEEIKQVVSTALNKTINSLVNSVHS